MHRRAMPPPRILLAALVLWPLLAAPCAVTGHLSLTAQPGWQLDNSAGFGNISLSGLRLPASVPQLLHRAGVVGDPLYRYNELQQRWVALDTWTLSLRFQAPPDLLRHRAVLLRCDGLDTVASIQLNGAPVALTANAHRHHTFNVTHLLVPGANVLNITLLPAPRYAAEQGAAYPYEVPATQQVGAIPGYNFVRKAASDFGWDWGPALAPAGINGGIQLLGQSSALLEGVAVQQQHLANGSVLLAVDGLLLPVQAPALEVQQQQQQQLQGNQLARAGERGGLLLQLTSPDGLQHWQAEAAVSIPYFDSHTSECDAMANCSCCSGRSADSADSACPWLLPGASGTEQTAFAAQAAAQPVKCSLSILLDSPRLWWPHDFGSQPLYSLRLTYLPASPASPGSIGRTRAGQRSGSISNTEQQQPNGQLRFAAAAAGVDEAAAEAEEAASATHSSTVTRRIGLRTVQLVTDPLPDGETFYFRVNGQPVYVRGANAVPAHVFEPAVADASLRRLVADAKAARMNMLRVWGGGRYFKDAFYEACDEQGVLVWQEAMFACAMYPRDPAFLREAWLEVRQQAHRLSSHPSVAIWGGNNENEAAFQWFPAPSRNPKLYASDYSKLFVDVVRQAVLGVDPGIPFVDSSPSNGVLSREPYVKRWGDVADPRYGDVHFYDYSSDAWDPATYPAAKFVSEFGFMSLPSFSAYRQVTEPHDWHLGAPMTAFRMRHAGGLDQLKQQMERHFLHAPQGVGASGPQPAASSGEQQQQAPQPQLEQQAQQAQQAQRLNGGAGLLSLHPNGSLKRRAVPAQLADPDPQGQEQRQFEALTYLSQLQQALTYQAAIHQWRRNKADPTARTMGVLFWQLNDVWQGPSWSAINSDGSWRLAQHFAVEFYKPVLLSGVKVGQDVQVHLTNDLPVHVTGLLAVDIVPYAATGPSHIAALIRLNVTIAAFDSHMVWSGSIAGDVLAAIGLVFHLQQGQQQAWQGNDTAPGSSSGSDSGSGGSSGSSGSGSGSRGGDGGRRRVEAADVFLRLRFCPTAVLQQQAAAGSTVPPPEPFGHNLIKLDGLVEGALHGGSDTAADRQAGAHSGGRSSIAPPCDAAVALLDGAAADQCEAACRLLQCSESLVLLTEPKDARMAPANVSIQLTHGGRQQEDADGSYLAAPADGGGTDVSAVSLRSDAVALFVAVENSARAGHFVGSGTLLLLPWQPQTLRFQEAVHPAEHREEGLGDISVYWLQKEMAALQSAMWLTEGAAHAAAARAAWFIAGFASVLLVTLGVCGWVKHAR